MSNTKATNCKEQTNCEGRATQLPDDLTVDNLVYRRLANLEKQAEIRQREDRLLILLSELEMVGGDHDYSSIHEPQFTVRMNGYPAETFDFRDENCLAGVRRYLDDCQSYVRQTYLDKAFRSGFETSYCF